MIRGDDFRDAVREVEESLVAIRAFDRAIANTTAPGDAAQAVLLVGEALVRAIRELGIRLDYAFGEVTK